MTYVIAEPCIDIKDNSCVEVCSVDCIDADDEDRMLFVSPDECIDCGACEPACPVTAIFAEDDVPDEWLAYTEINAIWFEDKDAARTKVTEVSRGGFLDGRFCAGHFHFSADRLNAVTQHARSSDPGSSIARSPAYRGRP